MSKDQLIIFDTTLRDGEQSPGASMTREEKLRIARQLERMRVDVIEAGFPAASNGDFEAVRAVAEAIKDSTVAGLCRAFDKDIARALNEIRKTRGIAIVVSEQVLSFAMDVADRLFVIEGGRLVHESARADTDVSRIKQYLSV